MARRRAKAFEADGAHLLRRNIAALAAVIGIGAPLVVYWVLHMRMMADATILMLFWAALLAHYAKPRPVRGEVVASRAGLAVGGEPVVAREHIAFTEVRAGVVALRGHDGRDLALVASSSDDELASLVDALALGRERRRVHHVLPRRTYATWLFAALAAVLGAAAIALGGSMWIAASAVGVLVFALALYARLARSVDVGTDGVLLAENGQRKMIPFSEVEAVAPFYGQTRAAWSGIELVLAGATPVRIDVERGRDDSADDGRERHARTRALMAEIERFRALSAGGADTGLEAELGRGEADDAAWLARLTELVRASGYRKRGVSADRLYRILDDPAAEPSARAGAAVVLQRLDEDEHRERLRIAAESVASPELRASLEALAEAESDEERRDALARVRR
jgi:hypothetical protein